MNSSVWAVWAVRAVREKKVDLRNSEQLLRVVFSTSCGQNKHFKNFLNYCRVRTKNLHKIEVIFFFFHAWKKNYKFQIGYHSNFDFECNTKRGFIDSLSLALVL